MKHVLTIYLIQKGEWILELKTESTKKDNFKTILTLYVIIRCS